MSGPELPATPRAPNRARAVRHDDPPPVQASAGHEPQRQAPSPVAESGEQAPARSEDSGVSPQRPRRVLVVEDDDAIREELVTLLRDVGHEVQGLRDGLHALRQLKEGLAVDLIVLDLRMPLMDGWEFRVEQRRDPALAAIPVVALSADHSAKAAAIDADAFLTKPFDGPALCKAVEDVLRRIDRERTAALRARTDRLTSLGLLTASLAHELRNPIAGVVGNLDLARMILEKGGDSQELQRQCLEVIRDAQESAAHLLGITAQLTGFASAGEGRSLAAVDVQAAMRMALSMARGELLQVAVIEEEFAEVPLVLADSVGLCQVFLNLLLNAAHALQGRTPRGRITVRTWTSEEGRAVAEVEDTGEGISPATRARLFEPFFTSKAPGTGTGLGLAVCHTLVHRFAGTIDVRSEPGQGATFRVVLPPAPTPAG
jgi:signal transduction histidine kinase